eukprot:6825283-Lingulodinium_polyedra.AAC.1
MGNALEGLVLVGQSDRRARAQVIRLSFLAKARDWLGGLAEELLPEARLDVAERWASGSAAKMLEGAPDVHVAAPALLGCLQLGQAGLDGRGN